MTNLAQHYPLYNASAFSTEMAEPSYWRATTDGAANAGNTLEQDLHADVVIIGAGFTGLNAAYALSVVHGLNVVVLEAGDVGAGATGRNGGFCCLGGTGLNEQDQIKRWGLDAALQINRVQRRAIDYVRSLCEQLDINVEASEMGELLLAHRPKHFAQFAEEARQNKKLFGTHYRVMTPPQLAEQGYQSDNHFGALSGGSDFGLHPLKYALGLAAKLTSIGVPIYQQSRCIGWQQSDGKHHLVTAKGSVTASKVVFATNGYTPEGLVPELAGRLLPLISSIRVTRPLTDQEIDAQNWRRTTCAFDSRSLLNYFRLLPDNRVLWGGRGGTNYSKQAFATAQHQLDKAFNSSFSQWQDVEVDYRWRGFVCMTGSEKPYVGEFRPGAYTSLGYHGNGVAMASWCGQAIAQQIVNEHDQHFTPSVFTQLPRKLPLRPQLIKLAYLGYEVSDRWL